MRGAQLGWGEVGCLEPGRREEEALLLSPTRHNSAAFFCVAICGYVTDGNDVGGSTGGKREGGRGAGWVDVGGLFVFFVALIFHSEDVVAFMYFANDSMGVQEASRLAGWLEGSAGGGSMEERHEMFLGGGGISVRVDWVL